MLRLSGLLAAAALSFAQPAGAAGFGGANDAMRDAEPGLVANAWHRGRPHVTRRVCTIRYRQYYNGLFWVSRPVRVCWRV